jgi:hypothetical protein
MENLREWLQQHIGDRVGVEISGGIADFIYEFAWRLMFVITRRACRDAADFGEGHLLQNDLIRAADAMFSGEVMQQLDNLSPDLFSQQPESSQPELSQPQPSQPQPSQMLPSQPQPSQMLPSQPQPSQMLPSQPQPSQPEPSIQQQREDQARRELEEMYNTMGDDLFIDD